MSASDISSIQGISAVRADPRNEPREAVLAATTARVAGTAASAQAEQPAVKVEAVAGFIAETPPVSAERVAEIRAAIKRGDYPLVPAQIADAMIAAPLLLSEEP